MEDPPNFEGTPMHEQQEQGRSAAFRRELGQQLRVDSVRASAAGGSGHPTPSMSAADLMALLLDGHLRLDFGDPRDPPNDRTIFSHGHAPPPDFPQRQA